VYKPPLARLRRDKNEGEVRGHLRACGYLVWAIHGVGTGDLLVWGRGFFSVVEVKGPKGKLTDAQKQWLLAFTGQRAPVFIARSGEDAVRMIREYETLRGP
jgi:hypothetical protein